MGSCSLVGWMVKDLKRTEWKISNKEVLKEEWMTLSEWAQSKKKFASHVKVQQRASPVG